LKKHILIILDGYGIAEDPAVSAIHSAKKPYLDYLFAKYPMGRLSASGLDVGLPPGQMGNSEVGHMNLGAGRIVYQDLTKIDLAIQNGSFLANPVLREMMSRVQRSGGRLHFLGLFSDGGVHSHLDHAVELVKMAAREGLSGERVFLHAFTDGRDTDPESGAEYVKEYESRIAAAGAGRIASIVGRYWAMDRDKRWSRIEKAYRLLVEGIGARAENAEAALQASYAAGVTDEFVEPFAIGSEDEISNSRIRPGDTVLFFNFRADRARQITDVLTADVFEQFERSEGTVEDYVTFSSYHNSYEFPVVFPKADLTHTIGNVIEEAGLLQLRAAETEKYPHVTYFFSGGRETPFIGEDRILIPSPKVATYDLQPEMSAPELADVVAAKISSTDYALVVLNFANADMVGHTGVFEAAVQAVEAVDKATRVVVEKALENGYSISIIADHGNSDKMYNEDGTVHTAHTTALVPHLIIRDDFSGPVADGVLGDVAPTILSILGIPIPEEMTGRSLVDQDL